MSYEVKLYKEGGVDNCYIVRDTDSGEALAVDPGVYTPALKSMIEAMGIDSLRYILLTHGHFDHIMGVEEMKKDFGGEVVIHYDDRECLHSDKNLGAYFGIECGEVQEDKVVLDRHTLPFGNGEITVIHTPGHTPGSVCYKLGDLLFTGDTLFNMNIGRMDFPSGSEADMAMSIAKLKALPRDYRVCPGHMDTTTLDYERKNNPYMRNIK